MKKLIDIATLIAAMGMTLTLCACSNNSDSGSTPTPAQEKYVIKVAQGVTGGKVTASAEQADAGTAITLTNTPNIGYIFNKYAVCAADGTAIKVQDSKFTMPQKNVIVAAFFTAQDYTVTFNANNGSETPATATQTFKAGESKDLTGIHELGEGFTKKVEGKTYYFVGWSTNSNAKVITECEYGDGAPYTGNQDIILYAVWIKDPVNDITISPSENGKVSSNASAADEGGEITLTITPEAGYKLNTLKVTAEGDEPVEVSGTGNTRTFIMPDKNVTVSATFIADEFTIATTPCQNGVIMTNKTAKCGEEVWLFLLPDDGYKAEEPVITAADGTKISPYKSFGIWTFKMPGQNVTISANFVPAN